MKLQFRSLALIAFATAPLLLAGCRVSEHSDGNNKKVDIDVPFANMHVNTNDNAPAAGTGLAVYPGATPVADKDDGKTKSANVDMSFGSFHLGVKASTFQTPDPIDKVEAFYRKDLAKYGVVIKCQGHNTIGTPTSTAEGLTCDDNDSRHKGASMNYSNSDDHNPELRAGSPTHQHVVGLESKNGGTRIGLVLLDLPRDSDSDHSKTAE